MSSPASELIQSVLSSQTGAHAVLLCGAPGSGFEDAADLLVRGLTCRAGGLEPCGECPACRGFERGESLDVLTIAPSGASRNIILAAIREVKQVSKDEPPPNPISKFIRTGPMAARHKVVRIREADRMTHGAANALLKMLEEPPPYVRFVLSTSELGALLPTVRSRCLTCACPMPPSGDPLDAAPIPAEIEQELDAVMAELSRSGMAAALKCSHRAGEAAARLAKSSGMMPRMASMTVMRAVSAWALRRMPQCPEAAQAAAQAAGRVMRNASAAVAFDAAFVKMAKVMELQAPRAR
jgi:DNA polymerase III delta prime subunit